MTMMMMTMMMMMTTPTTTITTTAIAAFTTTTTSITILPLSPCSGEVKDIFLLPKRGLILFYFSHFYLFIYFASKYFAPTFDLKCVESTAFIHLH